ncbi:adenylate kinase [Sulfurimonas sp.]|uniref:adenylate kinase n=1 Tax=Sulfurimonas sp. TaxID=2022749 RepID=UPI003D0ECDCD
MKKLFLIIGAPGSGKTTDAELIAKNNEHISHYSTGDMLRAEVARNTPRGQEINKYTSKGEIVPIAIVIETIVNAIKASKNNLVIIDGYPRSIEQMMELDRYLQESSDVKLTSVIEVEVDEETARDRVLGRARGEDDNNEVFDNRMKVYMEPLEEIRSFYNSKDLLKVISGKGTIDEIVSEMESFIKARI